MEFKGNIKWISPIILTKGGFKEIKNSKTKGFLLMILTIQGTYDMVDMVWKLGTYIKVEGG